MKGMDYSSSEITRLKDTYVNNRVPVKKITQKQRMEKKYLAYSFLFFLLNYVFFIYIYIFFLLGVTSNLSPSASLEMN